MCDRLPLSIQARRAAVDAAEASAVAAAQRLAQAEARRAAFVEVLAASTDGHGSRLMAQAAALVAHAQQEADATAAALAEALASFNNQAQDAADIAARGWRKWSETP